MKAFQQMLTRVTSSPHHDQMTRLSRPLNDHLGINHIWYYRITNEGNYSYLGTHNAWSEYCFDQSLLDCFPCLRHPSSFQSGVSLMKSGASDSYQKVLQHVWGKFQINFSINLLKKIPEGIEAFGFATKVNDQEADARLLNELPLLKHFCSTFRQKLSPLFSLIEENQVNIASNFGAIFYQNPRTSFPHKRDEMLQKLGFGWIFSLTEREKDLMPLLACGYPAPYIAEELGLGVRTIENYIFTLKMKLHCDSKSDLIRKAHEFTQICNL